MLQDRYNTAEEAEQINALQEAAGVYILSELYILEQYRDFEDVASKEASNTLLPH
jgi:hypothetical protein